MPAKAAEMPNTTVTSRSIGVPSIIMRRGFSRAPSSDSPKDDFTSARTARKHTRTTTKRVDVGRAPDHVEAEQSEHRCDHDALQPVVAAGDVGRAMDEVEQDHVQAERHHQQSDPMQAAHDATRGQSREACHEAGDESPLMGSVQPYLPRKPAV